MSQSNTCHIGILETAIVTVPLIARSKEELTRLLDEAARRIHPEHDGYVDAWEKEAAFYGWFGTVEFEGEPAVVACLRNGNDLSAPAVFAAADEREMIASLNAALEDVAQLRRGLLLPGDTVSEIAELAEELNCQLTVLEYDDPMKTIDDALVARTSSDLSPA